MVPRTWLLSAALAPVALVALVAPSAAVAQEAGGQTSGRESEKDLRDYVKHLERRVAELERERDWPLEQLRARSPSALEEAVRSINVSGYAEGLYSWNFQHGGAVAGRRGDTLQFSQLRAGDEDENGFSFRTLELAAERPLTMNGSTGFRVALHYGNAARLEDVDPAFDTTTDAFAVPEANFSWRAPFSPTDHVDLTIGKFRTWFGFETVESSSNWLVTRSANIAFGTPVTHTGLRAVAPVADKVEVGLAFVNGWDEVRDANDGKTGIAHVAFGRFDDWLSSKFQINVSYGAVEGVGTHQADKRRLFEVLWDGKLSEEIEVAVDVLWGDMPGRDWHGASAYFRHHFADATWLAARGSWYADDALATSGARIVEGSIALFHELAKDLVLGLEYRHDFSKSPGTFLDASGDPSRNQDTLSASFLYQF